MSRHTAAATIAAPGPARRPLLVTGDEQLLDELLRLAAAAGVEPEVATDPASARGRYPGAPLVLIGADQAAACQRARLPRRSDVVVVANAQRTTDPWAAAEWLGAAQVALLPEAETWLVERFAGCRAHGPPAPVVAVLGGRGGAGASVLAAGLAMTAAQHGRRALLIDADPLGGGLDLVLGWEEDGGLRWPELAGASGRVDPSALVDALPGRGELALLSFDRRDSPQIDAEAMSAVLAAGRAARELVVVDLPRWSDPAAVVALQGSDQALLVVPAEVRAATAAARVAVSATEHCAQVRLVVRGPAPGGLSAAEISESLALPLAGTLRPEQGLAAMLEGGMPPTSTGRGPLAVLCRRLVDELCLPATAAGVESRAA
ncbi:CpaE-like family protein [Natronosporangium hydrolyticum]|uniref:CpaE-like family protein n=1 Tax=Natronosporangium hydrolyticum TaxID=2811111 RepID=A0A895YIB5_9ACTN|nr:septum site-determining protein Ssd [Natronosporangium hydrolyticum]QSB14316.1 CpaE-like family protein [Natronosporangium hydrolyticum]